MTEGLASPYMGGTQWQGSGIGVGSIDLPAARLVYRTSSESASMAGVDHCRATVIRGEVNRCGLLEPGSAVFVCRPQPSPVRCWCCIQSRKCDGGWFLDANLQLGHWWVQSVGRCTILATQSAGAPQACVTAHAPCMSLTASDKAALAKISWRHRQAMAYRQIFKRRLNSWACGEYVPTFITRQ